MQVSCFAVLCQFLVIKIATSYSITPIRLPPQLDPASQTHNQQLLRTLLASTYNEASFPERLEILSAAIKQLPPKRNKLHLADYLKQSAIKSLTTAANVCKKDKSLPSELPRRISLRQIELPSQLPGQIGIVKKVELPVSQLTRQTLPGKNGFRGQFGLSGQKELRGQYGLPRQNGSLRQIEVASHGVRPKDASRRTVRIKYY